MVAYGPGPKISYFTTLGLNGSGSLTRPAPGLVSYGLAEESAEAVHSERRDDHHQQDHQQYPDALGNLQHRTVRPRRSLPIYALF